MKLVFLAAAVFLLMYLTEKFYQIFWNRNLKAKVRFQDAAVREGEHTWIEEIIENKKILPLPTLTVKFQLERELQIKDRENTARTDMQYRNDCLVVMPYQKITRRLEIECQKRGYYGVTKLSLGMMDLLYRKLLGEELDNRTWLYVYPAKSRFLGLQEIFQKLYGIYMTRQTILEDPFAFRGIRNYTPQDPMHKVNWKATARTGELKVNQFFQTTDSDVMILLNVERTSMLLEEDLLEEAIRMAGDFAGYFIAKGVPVKLYTNGRDKITGKLVYISGGAGSGHLEQCLKKLARIDLTREPEAMTDFLGTQIAAGNRSQVSVCISPNQGEEVLQAYEQYVGKEGSGTFLIPIHRATKQYQKQYLGRQGADEKRKQNLRVQYLLMEE